MTTSKSAIDVIDDANGLSVRELAKKLGTSLPESDSLPDELLTESQDRILSALTITGPQIFDDPSQWAFYRNTLAVIVQIDELRSTPESRSLEDYAIKKEARGNYNPLGELEELGETTIAALGERYDAQATIEEWISEDESPAIGIQTLLTGALGEIGCSWVQNSRQIELEVLEAMVCIETYFGTETVIEPTTNAFVVKQ